MKTQEQQKAELLDNLVEKHRGPMFNAVNFSNDVFMSYDAITTQKPLSADPFANEVFSTRVWNVLNDHFYGNSIELRLSECPRIKTLIGKRNFGYKSQMEYISVMKEYSFENKLQ